MITLLLILAGAALQAPPARHPVSWTRAVGPRPRQALEAKFKGPVELPRGQQIAEHKREIRTCVGYARAKKRGWEARNGRELATASFFKDQCYTAALVLAAKPSRVSYVNNFKLDESALDLLPPSMTFAPIGEVEDAADQAERQGLSWKKFRPHLKIREKSVNGITVLEPGENPREDVLINLEIKGFGDFNGDGIEDVLLFKEGHPVEGTFYSYHLVILTRVAADGPLKAFVVEDPEIERAMTLASQAHTNKPAKARQPKEK